MYLCVKDIPLYNGQNAWSQSFVFDPYMLLLCILQIKVPISDDSHYTTCTCFTIWRDQIWVGTNRGSISVMDTQTESRITELFFPGGTKRQVEIKQLAVSCEDEVCKQQLQSQESFFLLLLFLVRFGVAPTPFLGVRTQTPSPSSILTL